MKQLPINNYHFNKALNQYADRLRVQGTSEEQAESKPALVRELLHFMETVSINKLTQINQSLIDDYFEYLATRPLKTKDGTPSVAYLKKHREAVLRFIEFVQSDEEEEIEIGQSGIIIRIEGDEERNIEILTEEEIEMLYATTDYSMLGIRNRAMLSLLYGCGLRRKELKTLEVDDIDLSRGIVHLPKTKTKYARDVPMSPKVQQDIEDYLFNVRTIMLDALNDMTDFLITERGTAMSNSAIGKMMERTKQLSSIPKNITCHTLRHSIATHLHRYLPLEEVALFLGHKSLDATMIYTHLVNHYYNKN